MLLLLLVLTALLMLTSLQVDVEAGRLSSAQHETLVYANMRFNGPRLPGGALLFESCPV